MESAFDSDILAPPRVSGGDLLRGDRFATNKVHVGRDHGRLPLTREVATNTIILVWFRRDPFPVVSTGFV